MTADPIDLADPMATPGPVGEGAAGNHADVVFSSPQHPTPARRLHLGHVAFMRAVVQGLDTRDSWERYLRVESEHDDMRNVRRTIQWIRDEFAAAAKRSERFGTARLVQIDATRITDREPALPTLEEFAAEAGLLDFSQAEQQQQYQARYGPLTRRQSRRNRLIARQLEALAWLERLVAQPPQSGDPVASWLHPDLAAHLEAAGIFTVRQLVDRINGLGMRWWTGIRAVGAAKAERIMSWLREHQSSIGLSIGTHVQAQRSKLHADDLARVVPCATAIVPLEKFIVPAELDGSDGLYRAPQHLCLMEAKNDCEAVLIWIRSKHGLSPEQKAAIKRKRRIDPAAPEDPLAWLNYLSNTQRAYRKEAERFLLWAIVQHQKPLSSMTLDDCCAYRAFLASPTPADRWCGPRGREKWGPLWRPFEGPLSPRAQRQAITILKSLYTFLVDQRYLIGNPWNGVGSPQAATHIDQRRSFTQAQWNFIEQQLAQLPDTSANRRLRFALHFFYATGMRLAEAVAARVDHLKWVSHRADAGDHKPVARWELTVIGKGETERGVPVPLDVIGELSQYLVARGLDPNPKHASNHGAFLLGKAVDVAARAPWSPAVTLAVDPKTGIAPGTLYTQLKNFFSACAAVLTVTDTEAAQRLVSASTHWLRHTHGTHSVAAGTPLDVLQQNLGHASPSTTTIYATREKRRQTKVQNTILGKRAAIAEPPPSRSD
jgi:site-specific recombinase XerD